MGQTTSPDGGDLRYPCGSLEILSCSLEVLICQTLQVAKKLPNDMYELNMYLHEISIAKWETYFDIYTAFQRSSSDNYSSSGVGCALVSQQKKVCEEAEDHIQWNMRVEASNSIITDKDPMAKKLRIDNWKRLQRNVDAVRKPIEFTRDQSRSSGVDVQEATSKQEAEDAQQSINRLAYLAGIFLPFSIVAAIFSMGQEFAAGMPLFYVYWVISLPLSLGVIATIYADSIRRLTPSQLHMQKNAETRLNYNAADDYLDVVDERPLGWLGAYANLLRAR